jgi:hypothetical protein
MSIFVICVGPYPILETWPPIYRGQEGTVKGRLKASQVEHPSYFRYTLISTNFTFEFMRCPISPILSPSSRTFVELTLVTYPSSLHSVSFDSIVGKRDSNNKQACIHKAQGFPLSTSHNQRLSETNMFRI